MAVWLRARETATSSPPTHPCYSLPFRATDPNWVWSSDWQAGQTITWTTDPNWVWSSDWQAGQTITWTTDEANLFTQI